MKGSELTDFANVVAALAEAEDVELVCRVCMRCSEMVVCDDLTPAPAACMFCGEVVQTVGQSQVKRGDIIQVRLPAAACHIFDRAGNAIAVP